MKESTFQSHLLRALNASGRRTRFWRQNAGRWPTLSKAAQRVLDAARQLRRTGGGVRALVAAVDALGRASAEYWIEGAPKGAADLTGLDLDTGRRLEVEVKSVGAVWTEDQKRWMHFVKRSHGVYVLVRFRPAHGLEACIRDAVATIDRAIEEVVPHA